jgi:hypothetical protein
MEKRSQEIRPFRKAGRKRGELLQEDKEIVSNS